MSVIKVNEENIHSSESPTFGNFIIIQTSGQNIAFLEKIFLPNINKKVLIKKP